MIRIEDKECLETIKGIKYGVNERSIYLFSKLIYRRRSTTTNNEVVTSLIPIRAFNKQKSKIKGFS